MLKAMNFTPVTIRVLEFLSRDPAISLHGRELSKRAGLSSGAASLILRELYGARLVTLERKGRMKFYRMDLSNPVSRQFKVLFNLLALQGLLEGLREHADRVILFGSSVEGTNAKDSDMDMFILTQDAKKVRDILRARRDNLDRTLSPIIADSNGLARIRKDDRSLYENISRGIVLWQRE